MGQPARKDPKKSLVSLVYDQSEVIGKDPKKVYMWVDALRNGGPAVYEDVGWTLERHCEGAPKAKHNRGTMNVGDPIRGMDGMVLVSMPRTLWLELEQTGTRGGGGQDEADRIERMITKKGRGGGLDNPDDGTDAEAAIQVFANNEKEWPTGG